jgi:beta-phosphoglucomutase
MLYSPPMQRDTDVMRTIIFDFDGVLADTEPLHFEGLRRTLAGIGLTLTQDDYYANYLGFDDRGCILEALRVNRRSAPPSLVQELMQHKATAYLVSIKEHLVIFPGVQAFVEEAASAYPLAIASGALRPEIDLILEQAGIRKAFSHITSAEDVVNGKPDPEPFQHALKALNKIVSTSPISPDSCLVIEDSLPGIRAAKAAGMKVLAVANTHTAQDLHEAHAISHSLVETRLADLKARLWPS